VRKTEKKEGRKLNTMSCRKKIDLKKKQQLYLRVRLLLLLSEPLLAADGAGDPVSLSLPTGGALLDRFSAVDDAGAGDPTESLSSPARLSVSSSALRLRADAVDAALTSELADGLDAEDVLEADEEDEDELAFFFAASSS